MATAPVIRRLRPQSQPPARCKSGTGQSAKKRTARTHRHGFLNHCFQPFYSVGAANWNDTELSFFHSLRNICQFHGWTVPDVSGRAFPENITLAMAFLKQHEKVGLNILLLQDAAHPACLATAKTFDTSYRLYYIPVRPLAQMQADARAQPLFEMLLHLFNYLYQVCGVPFYTEPCYMDNEYDLIRNWIDEDDDPGENEYRQQQKRDLTEMAAAGNRLLPLLKQPFSLPAFRDAIAAFNAADGDILGEAFQEVCAEFYKLSADYPKRQLRDNMHYEFNESAGNDQIYWENYISFYWSGNDHLNETLFDMVNNELQEMGYQEEPMAFQWFDTLPENLQYDFDFEARWFALVNRLTELLNDYDDEEPHQ